MAQTFFDTNIILYLATDDEAKAGRAEELIADGGVVSVQVLNEFVSVSARKYRRPWPAIEKALAGDRRDADGSMHTLSGRAA